jgi:YVTN family beta-propeller protein
MEAVACEGEDTRMNARIFGVALAVAALAGCGAEKSASYTNSAGSLALSRDDAFLYAVDSDNDLMVVVDTAAEAKVAEVRVGRAPERIVVGPDDTIYVSNRGSRSVSVIQRGAGVWTETLQVPVGVEPVGLAVSPDNKVLYVVNSTSLHSAETGSLMAIDVKTLQLLWELDVGEEPRGVTVVGGNRALVTLYKRGDVVTVDLVGRKVISGASSLYERANASRISVGGTVGSSPFSSFHARAMADAVVDPDGKRAFVPTVWAREDAIAIAPTVAGGYYGNGGPCNVGAIATPGVVTFDATVSGAAQALSDDLTSCIRGGNDKDYPPTVMTTPDASRPIQGPVAAVVDPTGSWLFVVNRETNNVAVMPAARRSGEDLPAGNVLGGSSSIRSLVQVGAGPNGIAVRRDGTKAYVYNQFDHSISTLVQSGSGPSAQIVTAGPALVVAPEVLPPDVAAGRKLFFSATDARMTNPRTGTSCGTCHLDGRDDGHTWNFPDGPRQTPTLAGRALALTAPYHWNGEFLTVNDFLDHTVRLRMGGTGVTTAMSGQLSSFISVLAEPENPHRAPEATAAQLRGAQVFARAECSTCHGGAALTDNSFQNVGTLVTTGPNPDRNVSRGLNVPSLLGISRSAPYLHDGSALSLRERLLLSRSTNRHGKTSTLTDQDIDDLVEYLRTL